MECLAGSICYVFVILFPVSSLLHDIALRVIMTEYHKFRCEYLESLLRMNGGLSVEDAVMNLNLLDEDRVNKHTVHGSLRQYLLTLTLSEFHFGRQPLIHE